MLGAGIGPAGLPQAGALARRPPAGLAWGGPPLLAQPGGSGWRAVLAPRARVDPAIWTGPAIHVDRVTGNDAATGLGARDGDFSAAKQHVSAAFAAGNALGVPYRVIVRAGLYREGDLTANGTVEPSQPVALLAWGGRVRYRAGPWDVTWTLDQGTTYAASVPSVNRVLRTDQPTPEGLYVDLDRVADLAACRATPGSWFSDGTTVRVNLDVGPTGRIALIRNYHGARFLTHARDLYIEGFDIEGGPTGALHCDATADRTIVGVDCTFRCSAPAPGGAPLDAVQIRRTKGLVAFFGCDASLGAKDGWNVHWDRSTVASITRAGGTATVTTTSPHGLTTGATVTIAGALQPDYNGTHAIAATSPTTLTYPVAGSPATPATGAPTLVAAPATFVLLSGCTSYRNGWEGATSCNAVTSHDTVAMAVIGGDFGLSRHGTEVHCIEDTRTWVLGARATARDPDGSATAFKASNAGRMWLEATVADAAGSALSNDAIEANGGQVLLRGHRTVAGAHVTSGGGTIGLF